MLTLLSTTVLSILVIISSHAELVAASNIRLGHAIPYRPGSSHKRFAQGLSERASHGSADLVDSPNMQKRTRNSPKCRSISTGPSTTAPTGSETSPAPSTSQVAVSSSVATTSITRSSPSSTPSSPSPPPSTETGHTFTVTNRCTYAVNPIIADTKCGYSPRCSDAASFGEAQPSSLAPGTSHTVVINDNWVGRIFNQNGKCGPKGEDCTMLEFNLDTGSQYTAQAYDISNIQGFTQSVSVSAQGCDTATCTSASCSCEDAYPVGDMTGCGADLPVKACGPGQIAFDVVFCP